MSAVPEVAAEDAATWASRLMVRGVNVLPLRERDKRPSESWERWSSECQLDALPDPDRWIADRWPGHNVGAVTGKISGIVVVDLDSEDAVGELSVQLGELPRTVTAWTHRGAHLWFAYPSGVRIRNRARLGGIEIDVRGDGGYVVVPPSIHPSGTPYAWDVSPLELWPPLPVPGALLELLRPPPRPLRAVPPPEQPVGTAYIEAAVRREIEAVMASVEGQRNHTLNVASYNLARFVATGDLDPGIEETLVRAGTHAGLTEREAHATVRSAFRSRGVA